MAFEIVGIMSSKKAIEPDSLSAEPGHARSVARITWIGLIMNVLLSLFKLAAGVWGRSQAIVADGVHSLSDSSTDIAILIGVRYWSRPPDRDHPYGHRRIETLVTAFIGLALAVVAGGLIWNAIDTFQQPHPRAPHWAALAAALVSIVSKEILYRWTVSVGRRISSSAVLANAWHHRSDAFSSIPTAIAVAMVLFRPSLGFLDHLAAVVVSFFILRAAWKVAVPALKELVDSGAPPKDFEKIRSISLATEGVRKVHAIRSRYVGPGLMVDLHVMVDPQITVRKGHDVCKDVKMRLRSSGLGIVDVTVHLEPDE